MSGSYVSSGYWVAGYAEGDAGQSTGMFGFEQGGVREVSHKRLLDKILEARAERIKPLKKNARKRARVIEVEAAELAQAGGNEAQFYALMQQWLDQKPQLPETPGLDVEQMFMAQVAMQVQRIQKSRRLFEQDEEEALLVLLLA